jgi:hypothetical protein
LKLAGGVIWVIVAVGFITSALSFFGILIPAHWWRPLAIVFAVISLVALILFRRSWPLFNFISASGLNIAVLVALLWLHWPPKDSHMKTWGDFSKEEPDFAGLSSSAKQ